jgi:hypothetical protein
MRQNETIVPYNSVLRLVLVVIGEGYLRKVFPHQTIENYLFAHRALIAIEMMVEHGKIAYRYNP